MPNIAIVTDSTATIPDEFLKKYNIHVAPQVLIWNGDTYEDGIDIQTEAFYNRLATAKIMPSTSQATPATFARMFKQLLEQDCEILTITVSAKLSGTIQSALNARDMHPGAPIEIVDSYTTAMAMGFQVLEAARAAEEGATLPELVRLVEHTRLNSGLIFAVDTLEFLHRGGRIGGASRFLGTALNIKPILEVQDGKVEAVERVRTRTKSMQRLVELAAERIGGRTPVHLSTLHANSLQDARQLYQMTAGCFDSSEHLFTEVSPVIGTHTGPGTVGLAFVAGV